VRGADLRLPLTTGEKPLAIQLFNLYLNGIGLAPREDYSVRRSLVEVGAIDAPIMEFFSSIRRHARRSGSAQGWVRQINATLVP
jgi:hypothetical protein